MTNEEFRKEMLDYIDSEYTNFLQYQEIVSNIYSEFERVCKKYSISQCAAFGSLLGLHRDHGFIPWDYDMDVFVPYKEVQVLINALDKDLGDDFYYVYSNNMKDYPLPVMRVCQKGYSYMAVHVDVFFLIGLPQNPADRERHIKQVSDIEKLRLCKYIGRHTEEKPETLARAIYTFVQRFPGKLVSDRFICKEEKRLFEKYQVDENEFCMHISTARNKHASCYYSKIEEKEYNGRVYSVPARVEEALNEEFGDYSVYFPIKARFTEFYKLLSGIEKKQQYYKEKLKKRVER